MVVVAHSGPGTAGAERALSLRAGCAERGEPATLVLLGDAVLLAQRAAASSAGVICVAEDLELRGLTAERLAGVRRVDYGQLVDVLLGGGLVVGAL